MQFGLKLGSKDTNYTENIFSFYQAEYFQYIELFVVPESFEETMEQHKVQEHLIKIGKIVQHGWNTIAKKTGLALHVGSIYPLSHFDFQDKEPLVLKTLFTQEMLDRGYLATNSFYCSFAHAEDIVQRYLDTVEEVFYIIKKSIDENTCGKLLRGPVCQSGFKRLN